MIDEFKPAIRRDDINMIGKQRLPQSDQHNRHRPAASSMRQFARAVRIEMNNHNKGGAGLRGDDVTKRNPEARGSRRLKRQSRQ